MISLLLAAQLSWAADDMPIIPRPQEWEWRQGNILLDQSLQINAPSKAPRLRAALNRFKAKLPAEEWQFNKPPPLELKIKCGAMNEIPKFGESESYEITIGATGVDIYAYECQGAVWALETLTQLLPKNGTIQHLKIKDKPRYAWRGLMLDPARRFLTIVDLKRTVDLMTIAKLNVLHLHLSDDQGFRMESKVFPALHQKGSEGQYYTQTQMKKLVKYAALRGIRVIPEFDMPGHMHAWFMGHPELSAGKPPQKKENKFGIHHQTLHPKRPENRLFLTSFIKEMKTIFPDKYWFLGADEVTGKQWEQNESLKPIITELAKEKPRSNFQRLRSPHTSKTPGVGQLYAQTVRDLVSIIEAEDKKVIVWDDAMDDQLQASATVVSYLNYIDEQPVIHKAFAQTTHPLISSEGWYMNSNIPLRELYQHDPDIHLGPDAKNKLLGGLVCMWGEFTSSENLDIRLWPGVLAPAEVMWTNTERRNYTDFKKRLKTSIQTLEKSGAQFKSNRRQMLNRLAKGRALTALTTLADHMILVSGRQWRRDRAIKKGVNLPPMNTDIPLNHFPDALNAFPAGALEIEDLVEAHLKGDSGATKQLVVKLTVLTAIPQALENHRSNLATADRILKSANMLSQWAALGIQALHPASQHSELHQKYKGIKSVHIETKVGIKHSILKLIQARKATVSP